MLGAGLAFGASIFYVSPVGDDGRPGTKAKPWKTLQHAADLTKPGTIVNIMGGEYCQTLAIKVSGDSRNGFITFRSQPGQKAVLDGSCLAPPEGGTRDGTALVSLRNVSYVRIEGLEIRNYRTDDRRRTPAGARCGPELGRRPARSISVATPGSDPVPRVRSGRIS